MFLIRELGTGEEFAAKVYSSPEEEKVPLIRAEARILEGLSHPSIVKFKQFYEEEGLFILITEYFRGVPLEQFIENRENEAGEQNTGICRQVVEVVNYLIDQKVVHGDFNPSNLLINPGTREIRLIDFGLSRMGGLELQSPKGFLGCRPPLSLEGFYQGDLYDVWGMILVLISVLVGQNVGSRGVRKLVESEKGGNRGNSEVWRSVCGYLREPKSPGGFLKELLGLLC